MTDHQALSCERCGSPLGPRPDGRKPYKGQRFCNRACAHAPRPAAERLWKHVRKTETCLVWEGASTAQGYGTVNCGGGQYRQAHVLSYEAEHGPVPAGMWVLHRCDNPPCVNPAHLFLGTRDDNIADMVQKGRSQRGESHYGAKVTESAVRALRARHAAGESVCELAKEFGIRHSTCSRIISRKTWKHVGAAIESPVVVGYDGRGLPPADPTPLSPPAPAEADA